MIEAFPLVEIQPPPPDLRIVKAAVKINGGMYTAWRHSDILGYLGRAGTPQLDLDAQGFVADNGSFYNRYQSARIALRARQIQRMPHILTSEDLWDVDGTPRDGLPYDPMGDSLAASVRQEAKSRDAVAKSREMIERSRGRSRP